jgi:menaquinol-cytochrome c reductase iron-sulfur subunit
MKEQFPKKISRRSFLGASGKLAIGAAALLAGSSGLFYYGAVKHRDRETGEWPGNIVKLGELNQLAAIHNVRKISYETTVKDAWAEKPVKGFVYVRTAENGEPLIISPLCTHLGCTIDPVPEAERGGPGELFFWCPCHGAEFDLNGDAVKAVTQGLDTYQPIIADGSVFIDILSPIKGRTVNKTQ